MKYYSLIVFYFVYFVMNGFSTFVPKYYGEIGLSASQIGIVTSISTIVAVVCSPALAVFTDRVPKKRYMLSVVLVMMALGCFLAARCAALLPLLLAVSLFTTFYNSALPLVNTISLEYTRQTGQNYGRIRLFGTVGYQAGALLAGAVMSASLKNLYPMMGAISLASCAVTFAMPNIEGHQHNKKKVPLSRLFADRHVRWLYGLLFFSTVSSQFYQAFYTKHLGDLGMSNAVVSWITLLSVAAELPFLFFGNRIARKTHVWNWILLGLLLNSVRWIGLAFSTGIIPILLCQIPGVTVLACYEYFPALYLNRKVADELSGSAQNILALTMFGAAKVVGSLIGGQICEYTDIPTMFVINGIIGLAGCALFWPKIRRLAREDTVLTLAD